MFHRALRALAPSGGECCVGLVVGTFQGASDSVEALVGVAAQAQATAAWRLMGARDQPEAVGIFTHRVRRRWGATFWRTWASTIRSRAACVGRPDAAMLRHGPVPAARGVLAAVGEPAFPQAGPDLGRLGGLAELGDAGAYD